MVGNKRGWMRILEATVAVMIVAGVLVVVYSGQVDRGIEPADYFYSLQRQILMDISSSSALRLDVLNANEDPPNDEFVRVYDFIGMKIPNAFGYTIRICELGDVTDFCKIDNATIVREIRDKDVFVEDVVISSDIGSGSGDAAYRPRKLRLFVWEGLGSRRSIVASEEPPEEPPFVMPTGLVSWWKFEDDVLDDTGANHGINKGATFVGGIEGMAASFGGSGDWVDVGDSLDWDFGTEGLTISLWMKMDTVGNHPIVEMGVYNSNGFLVRTDEINPDTLSIYVGNARKDFNYVWESDTWYHLVIVKVAGVADDTLMVFINGTQVGSGINVTGSTISVDNGLRIGGVLSGSTHDGDFDGLIDEVAIFDRAISSSDILDIYNEQRD